MKYDFDQLPSRRGTGSLKWDECAPGELPMWVADMDFPAAPEIRRAIEDRAAHGVFGYNIVPEEWYDAYIGWWSRRHSFEMDRDWLISCTGVVPAISSCVRKLTTPAEKVLIETPVYNIFFNSILNNGRVPMECPLVRDGEGYHRDLDRLELAMSDPQVSLMILCNPHNPVGRLWTREELAAVGEMARAHGVTVISDEIHCDITAPGSEYVPFASASPACREISVTCIAPTKAFNLAGLQTAAVCVPNPLLRHKVWRALNTDEAAEPNSFAVTATVAAFTKGGEWLDQLREYLFANRQAAESELSRLVPEVGIIRGRATYLLWLDCSGVTDSAEDLCSFIRSSTGLYISPGGQFGSGGEKFVRVNLALPRAMLLDGMERFARGVRAYENQLQKK